MFRTRGCGIRMDARPTMSRRRPVRCSKVNVIALCAMAFGAGPAAGNPATAYSRVEITGAHAIDASVLERVLAPPIATDSVTVRLRRMAELYWARGWVQAAVDIDSTSTDTL